ncbi:hypothetical protein BCT10_21010 [Vibrio splendidus]|nr:hypothetical protein BCT10_21010 [Vibrio splendidus]
MILTRTCASNVMRNALELAQSKILFEYRIGIPRTNAELRLYRKEIHLTKWKFKIRTQSLDTECYLLNK